MPTPNEVFPELFPLVLASIGCCLEKIQSSDVVDIADHTLEQDVLIELTGLRHFYEAVLTTNRKRTSDAHKGEQTNG